MANQETNAVWICESCVHCPPSSFGGKPCAVCNPHDPLLNYYQNQEGPVATNADRIRAMSNEELAVLLEGCICPSEPCKKVVNRERQPDKKMCQSCWLDWLKQEARDD